MLHASIVLQLCRGYGVRAMEIIPKGTYIVEYVGEVIGVKELGRRMDHARQNDEPHFYIMEQAHGRLAYAVYTVHFAWKATLGTWALLFETGHVQHMVQCFVETAMLGTWGKPVGHPPLRTMLQRDPNDMKVELYAFPFV